MLDHIFVEPYRFSREIKPHEYEWYEEHLRHCGKCGALEKDHPDKYTFDDPSIPKCTICGVSSIKHGYVLHNFK